MMTLEYQPFQKVFGNIPDGIIITIPSSMYEKHGYRTWLKSLGWCMCQDDCVYWIKSGAQPKYEVQYVYLCIDGRIRFRVNYAGSEGPGEKLWGWSKAWISFCGPLEKASEWISMKGFRGFRYTTKLF